MILWFFNETNCAQSRLLFIGKKSGKEGVIKKCKIESLLAKSGENDRFRGQIGREIEKKKCSFAVENHFFL